MHLLLMHRVCVLNPFCRILDLVLFYLTAPSPHSCESGLRLGWFPLISSRIRQVLLQGPRQYKQPLCVSLNTLTSDLHLFGGEKKRSIWPMHIFTCPQITRQGSGVLGTVTRVGSHIASSIGLLALCSLHACYPSVSLK